MNLENNTVHLYSSEFYSTNEPAAVYKVLAGSVEVYIAPQKNEKPVNRQLLCIVESGHLIPAFCFRDSEYKQWRFFLTTPEEAEMLFMPDMVTSVLKKKFLLSSGISTYDEEGYEQSLIEFYVRENVKSQAFIQKDKRDPVIEKNKAGKVISNAFEGSDAGVIGGTPLYKAVTMACRSAHIPIVSADKLATICGKDVTLQNIAGVSGFSYRSIILDENWYKSDCGVIIGKLDDRDVAFLPRGQSRYSVYYGDNQKSEVLTASLAEKVDPHAFLLYRTLPPRALKKKDLFRFALESMRKPDVIALLLLSLVAALIGILLPSLNQKIYDDYIPLGNYSQMIQLCVVIASFMIGNLFFDMVKNLSEERISGRIGYDIQNAVYARVFRLSESFMRKYESADMAQRLSFIREYADTYIDTLLISGVGAVFSVLYLYKMFKYAKKLAWMALIMIAVYLSVMAFATTRTVKHQKRIGEKNGESGAKLYQYLNGIEKIRLAGAEDRAVLQYLIPFSDARSAQIKMNRHTSFMSVLSGVATTLFTMVFYYIIVKKNVSISTGSFMAFNSAFGSFSAAFIHLTEGLMKIYQLKPYYERFAPVIESAEEDDENSEIPAELNGGVSLKNVTFSYVKNGPVILNNISLDIKPGEYIGIVGSSGCGKSTLLKLLLGFETPDSGVVCYDDKDIRALDKRRLRKNLGVVLQNGQLISGSIYENITVTSPNVTRAQVEAVIETVGLRHDIDNMPMGLETVLSENSGTVSGGQKQRILIARAIINNPSILIFDEATSALDNLTQAAVSENLDKMDATRIVVAHRLSTIKNCDRIIVLDGGKIVEEGKYDNLMSEQGLFYKLASRQMVD